MHTTPVKLNNIQILRGFAAIAVLLFHLDDSTKLHFDHTFFHFTYGYLGVDFFFALSGFIITYMHLKDVENRGSVRNFLIKRAVRVYPMYWLSLLATMLILAPEFAGKPQLVYELDPSTGHGIITILKNIVLFPLRGEQMPVRVAWTLIYEMFFYAVFACCIALGWKKARVIYFVWAGLVLIFSRDVIARTPVTETMFGSLIMEFLFGCLAGYLFLKMKRDLSLKIFISAIVGIAAVFTIYLMYREFNRYAILATILMGAASALIILYAAQLDRKRLGSSNNVLLTVGDASYSIYITHSVYTEFICKAFVRTFNIDAWSTWLLNVGIVIIFLISLCIGVLIHLYIEKPVLSFLRTRFKVSKRTMLAVGDSTQTKASQSHS